MPGYTVKAGVILKPEERKFVAAVAKDFNGTLVVTSGYRGPKRQAAAMYTKFGSSAEFVGENERRNDC